MKTKSIVLGLMSFVMAACTLSVSDKNPKPLALFGEPGASGAAIMNGSLTLSGSNLNQVTSLALTQTGGPNAQLTPFTLQTRSMLTAALPSVLRLPGVLIVSTSASAEQVELSALNALSVDGTLSVGGNTTVSGSLDAGFMKVEQNCPTGIGFCIATCPVGLKVISGGCSVNPSSVGLSANFPSGDNQWSCRPTASAIVFTYVICGRTTLTYQ